ncbi:MAG TPA: xanthine dehydrogenase family protein molybdopterin-binding subunit [Methylomirabilota bacterium]|nr:xanthine dehydrogenase family protein molybdopterin-binding subunit [Methylomirabilota bacterium]
MIGASVKRKEDARLVTGRGRYVEDIAPPGLLHLAVVRSPHAHARIVKIDARAALKQAGVVAVFTVGDAPELGGSVPPLIREPGWAEHVHPVMASGRVRHAGEAVAAVIADHPYRAADAAAVVRVEYEPLPVAATPAVRAAGAVVHDGWRDNVLRPNEASVGDVGRGFADAEVTVRIEVVYPRVTGVPIEGRAVLAAPEGERLTVWSSTQVPFNVRTAVASALGIPEASVRVVAPDVGGGFGIKGHVYPEEIMIPAIARRLGRPVKWVEARSEHFLTASGDRDQVHAAKIGVKRDGTITAIETRFTRDHGAFPTLGGAMTANTINHLVGPYRVPNYHARGENVVTHKTFAAAYRGAGRPEAALVLDRLLDRAARRLGLDAAELRRRNLIRREQMPFATGLTYRDGAVINYDPADYVAAFDALLERLDWASWRKEQAARRGSARPLGLGVSAYVEGTGLGPFEGADVSIDPSGDVFVDIGVGAQGQAHETTLAQIAAAELGMPLERVRVRGGDTDRVGFGLGTIASRVAAVAGPAIARSSREVARKAKLVAAEMFECAPEDVVVTGCEARVAGAPDKRLPLGRVARAAVRSKALVETGRPGLGACVFFYPGTVTWAFGAQAAVVEVDVETCAIRVLRHVVVHDPGRAINPMIVEGQVHGGTAQGLGSALLEEIVHDEQGQLLTGSLMDYALPRAGDFPAPDVVHVEFPSMVNELGIKGVGESGVIAPGAMIAGAVEDALADRGVTIDRLPVTPARVFEALRAARRASDASRSPDR